MSRFKTNLKLIQSVNLGDYVAGIDDEAVTEITANVGMEQEELRNELYGFVSVYLMKLDLKREQVLN